jgi:hypothetical protein
MLCITVNLLTYTDLRKLHNAELHYVSHLAVFVVYGKMKMKWAMHVAGMGWKTNTWRV